MDSSDNLNTRIKTRASELGFDRCGIVPAVFLEKEYTRFGSWIKQGFQAGMNYLERNSEKRADPGKLVENAKSVIVVLMRYASIPAFENKSPKFSRYALGRDYHLVLKEKLHELLDFIEEEVPGTRGRVFVDSAPVMERSLAVRAGLGWIGRNSMLINRNLGSYTFIGEIITDLETEYDEPFGTSHCGSCSRCIDSCPTGAILPDRSIDSNKCISYVTIEHRGPITELFRNKMNGWVFGCDICQEVCPWNSKPGSPVNPQFEPKPEFINYTPAMWRELDKGAFDEIFKDSPLLRTGYKGFKRNLEFIDPA